MKVRFRHISKHKRIFNVVFFSVLIIGVGMLLPRVFSAVSASVMYPVHVTNTWLKESSNLVPVFIRDRQSLQGQVESLKNELVIKGGSNLTQQRLVEENARLRRLLGADEETRTAAAVIARPSELPYDLLQINRGSLHGIEVGSPVFLGRDIVIGLVVHTATEYSFVELITTPGFEATVFISGPNVAATLEGYGGGVARVRVPQGIHLSVGNLVYLPSVEPGVFGRISHIENRPTQPEQYGYISPDIAISSIYQVSVGKRSQISHETSEINERILEQMKTELLLDNLNAETSVSTSTVKERTDSNNVEE
ncbi:MAG: cell shape-determining protein MreC [Candidatus Paceibacteria bacterium]|jgi:cell shape-determining protein MreC